MTEHDWLGERLLEDDRFGLILDGDAESLDREPRMYFIYCGLWIVECGRLEFGCWRLGEC